MKRTYLMFSLLSCTVAGAQTVGHEHSACDNDSIDPMKEAILSEITVEGVTGSQRLKDSPIPFSVISPKTLHGTIGTNLVDAIAHQPGLTQIHRFGHLQTRHPWLGLQPRGRCGARYPTGRSAMGR